LFHFAARSSPTVYYTLQKEFEKAALSFAFSAGIMCGAAAALSFSLSEMRTSAITLPLYKKDNSSKTILR